MKYRNIRRREFLRLTVVAAAGAAALPSIGCSKEAGAEPGSDGPIGPSKPEDVLRVFPQGVASGDPTSDSVILWTRAVPKSGSGDVSVSYAVATDEAFKDVVAQGKETAKASADNTIRLKVTKLSPFKTYYYRFVADGVRADIGRTKTAPSPDQDTPVRFAFASCQDFVGRYYHAWKVLADDDAVDFVVYLGDYIYETDGNPSFMTPTEARKIELPDGTPLTNGKAAKTLADYRSLYQQYRSDPDLQRAHRLFPFVTIWDDHEFGDDCWQDHTTHFSDTQDETFPEQREAADQAWFEYQPADVEYDENASYPNDIKIYRNRRFGKHMELFLTDQRYYRSDHVVPEGPTDGAVGKIVADSAIGSRIFVLKSGFDPLEAAAKPTMLGETQKAWFVDSVKASSATWKIWGSETQLAQMLADLSSFALPAPFNDVWYLTVDQWDGYRSERKEILGALSGVDNLVVVTGDIHAFYASELHVDFDAPAAQPVAVEYVVAGVSSQAIAPAAEATLSSNDIFKSLGLLDLIPRFDELLQSGSPHYKYANSWGNGIATCAVSADHVEVTFMIVGDVTNPDFDGQVERKTFRTPLGSRTIEVV